MFFCLVFGFNPICILGEHDSTPSLEKAHFQYNFGGPDAVTVKNYCWMERTSTGIQTGKKLHKNNLFEEKTEVYLCDYESTIEVKVMSPNHDQKSSC